MKIFVTMGAASTLLATMSASWAAGTNADVMTRVGDRPGATIVTPVQRFETPSVALPVSLPVEADINVGIGANVDTPELSAPGLLETLPVPGLLESLPGALPQLPVDPASLVGTVVGLIPAAGGGVTDGLPSTGGLPSTAAVAGLLDVVTGAPATVLALVPAGQLPSLSLASLTNLVSDSTAALPIQPGEVLAIVQRTLPVGGVSSPLSALPLGALPLGTVESLPSTVTGAIPSQLLGTVVSVVRMVPVSTVERTVSGVVQMVPVSTDTGTVLELPNVVLGLLPLSVGGGSPAQSEMQLLGSSLELGLLDTVDVGVDADIKVTSPQI